jgi:hypothetical protein
VKDGVAPKRAPTFGALLERLRRKCRRSVRRETAQQQVVERKCIRFTKPSKLDVSRCPPTDPWQFTKQAANFFTRRVESDDLIANASLNRRMLRNP